MARHHEIRYGTSGWNFPEWVGPFYPESTPTDALLPAYALHHDLVEVDAIGHSAPSAETIDSWRQMTPRGFQFTLRVPPVITHEKVLLGCREEFRAFAEVAGGLGNKLRCVLLQFDVFTKQAMAQHKTFFERLDTFLDAAGEHEIPIAVEIRNKNWLTAEWFDLLRKHHAAAVLVDHPWMPPIPDVLEKYDALTAGFTYVRLLGDREAIEKQTKRWDRTVVDRSASLARTADALRDLVERVDVLVIASNHFAGHAPATLTEIAALIGREQPIEP